MICHSHIGARTAFANSFACSELTSISMLESLVASISLLLLQLKKVLRNKTVPKSPSTTRACNQCHSLKLTLHFFIFVLLFFILTSILTPLRYYCVINYANGQIWNLK